MKHSVFPVDVAAHIDRARTTPRLLRQAQPLFASLAADLFQEDKPRGELHVSDLGSCGREISARIAGLHDIAPEPQAQKKMDLGTLNGAWNAALFTTSLEDEHGESFRCILEPVVDFAGMVGHIDVDVRDYSTGVDFTKIPTVWVVEFKLTFASFKAPEAASYQKQQALGYALARKALGYTVVVEAPGTPKGKGSWNAVEHFEVTAEDTVELLRDVARLETAVKAGPRNALADPEEPWRCGTCRYSGCEKNKNPNPVKLGVA